MSFSVLRRICPRTGTSISRVHPSTIIFSGDRRFISCYIVVMFIDILTQTFLFIRPTAANLAAYERWSGSEIQSHTWLGDMVDEVTKVDLSEGNTMIIPTGWIHAVVRCPRLVSAIFADYSAVYAPRCTRLRRQFPPFIQRCTSYVCLVSSATRHSFPVELRVHEIEIATHVPKKFRFPLFTRSVSPNMVT